MKLLLVLVLSTAIFAEDNGGPPPVPTGGEGGDGGGEGGGEGGESGDKGGGKGEPCEESFARRAHPSGDCRRYQSCLNRVWVDKECRLEGHVYNLGYRQCRPGRCAEGGCEKKKMITVDDPDCKMYEICWYDQWLPRKCSGNTIFHEDFQGCFTGTCEDRGPPGQILDTCISLAPGEKKQCDKPWEYKAVKEDCNKYNICFFNFWVQGRCSEGLRFDEARRLCVTNDGDC